MPYDMTSKLKIAVTTRALFSLEKENELFDTEGLEAYEKFQIDNEEVLIEKGVAFSLVKQILKINAIPETKDRVEVIIVTRNNGSSSLRVFNSIKQYALPITRGFFTGGDELVPYLKAMDVDLFLTANQKDAQKARDAQIPTAVICTDNIPNDYAIKDDLSIRIAFDGDAVLFSDDSEVVYKTEGLESFKKNESELADVPMTEGPFFKFLKVIADLQKALGEKQGFIKTALITARDAPSHERVIKTLRNWGVRIDEMFFLGGIDKTPILEAFGAQIFFDDQKSYTGPASAVVPSATVPYSSDSKLYTEE